jgi:hypothetical protein
MVLKMAFAVELNSKALGRAIKIEYIIPNAVLTAKFATV